MGNYRYIIKKLEAFIRKYYLNRLIKGSLLFLVFGLLFFLVVSGVEYILWLGSGGRLLLLIFFVGVVLFLMLRYIFTPLFFLFKMGNGIDYKVASRMIGKHFPEVDDKLQNLLELANDEEQSELLLASIERRSLDLRPVPFVKAIDFNNGFKYARYLAIPLFVIVLIWIFGNISEFMGSYNRVVNYDLAYAPPAPFHFVLVNTDLTVLENEPVTIKVRTEGEIRPSGMTLVHSGRKIIMKRNQNDFEHTLSPPLSSGTFYFESNGHVSREFALQSITPPSISDFELVLNYPPYLGKKDGIIKSSGNAVVPEGTRATWRIRANNTTSIGFSTVDTLRYFEREKDLFSYSQRVFGDLEYSLSTSNEQIEEHENLTYGIKVVRDAFPTIKVQQIRDSLRPNRYYFMGEMSDDHGLETLRVVVYPIGDTEKAQSLTLGGYTNVVEPFYYTFPSGFNVSIEEAYRIYFEVTDNDAVHGGKRAKSREFDLQLLDNEEINSIHVESQRTLLEGMDSSLKSLKKQREELMKVREGQKEKAGLDFDDRLRVKEVLEKQSEQEAMMQRFSKELEENLKMLDADDERNRLLRERLKRQEMEAIKNERLLEELESISEKLSKEELSKKLDEVSKRMQNSQRNLEQLLELTKRYYVSERTKQLANELQKMGEKQELLPDGDLERGLSAQEQEKLNKDYEELSRQLDELKKDNKGLREPMDLNIDGEKQGAIKEDQESALEEMSKQKDEKQGDSPSESESGDSGDGAKKKQKAAAQKMKQMSQEMNNAMSMMGGGSSIAEDAEMLRQILDNLVTFSFKQERLYDGVSEGNFELDNFSATIKEQNELRRLFEHVDDSLFALSLRNPDVSEFVNEQITEVFYNIDGALDDIAQNRSYQGASHQKYVVTASNSLADYLAGMMDNMMMSMMSGQGQGQGDGKGMQLPDIIKSQEELQKGLEGMSGGEGQKSGEQEGQGKEGGSDKSKENGGEGDGETDGGQQNGSSQKEGRRDRNGGSDGNGKTGPTEAELAEMYEIFKRQQQIRHELERQLDDMINSEDRKLGQKLVRQMEEFENDLLRNGITQRTRNKMNTIKHQMLKLRNAALRQGRESKRESNSNDIEYVNPIITAPEFLKGRTWEFEILNREALPLRPNFKNRVRTYFNQHD